MSLRNRIRTAARERYAAPVAVPRPKRETTRMDLRISPEMKRAAEAAALAAGMTLSAWVKAALQRELKRSRGKK
jgi:predicted HicB family RNase H-like nuclease